MTGFARGSWTWAGTFGTCTPPTAFSYSIEKIRALPG